MCCELHKLLKNDNLCYMVTEAMYSTLWQWPTAVLLCRSYFALRTGHIFFEIWEKLSDGEKTAKARSKIKAELCLHIPGLAQLVFHGRAVFVVLEPVSGEGLGGVGAVGVLAEAG